ncbi:hypothetical protein L2E82_17512 [Cichorium intybus]|uniref:Uncharacterized protein n=1 Tax=Cichorium intybus TaxID=13427 RepID=A0ACB9F932_CICIN|nr:hypothetical protein L2E82_17512 [Cichorium intybus]
MARTCSCCGYPTLIRVSNTSRNPGRQFYACSNKMLNCGFNGWVDEDNVVARIQRDRELRRLQLENRNLKIVLVLSWMLFVAVLVYKL